MRSGLTVVGVCFLLSIAIAWGLKETYRREWAATQDVFMGLTYFMEANGGRFPASEDEFVRSDFVERLPDGSLKIKVPAGTKFNTKLRGVPIADLKPFKIQWGADVAGLTLSENGVALDANKQKVELICWPSSPPSGKTYTMLLIDVWRKIKG